MPSRPSKNTATLLWGACGNECANPNCNSPVLSINKVSNVVEKIGQIAHIKGDNPESNRYDPSQSDEERHHYDNLFILCPKCHTEHPDGIDIPANEKRFPTEILIDWKHSHLEKIRQLNDRNWVCNPNSVHLFHEGVSIGIKYWIDKKGQPQLYTAEQLAIVEQLFKFHLSFSQLNSMLKMIEDTEGKPIDPSHQTLNDAIVGSLYKYLQQLPRYEEYGWIGYVSESMQIAQDITLGELHTMWVQDGLSKKEELRKRGQEMLRNKASTVDPEPKFTEVKAKNENAE